MLHPFRVIFAQRQLDLRFQSGHRRLELVRGVGDEPVLEVQGLAQALHQLVDLLGQRPHFAGDPVEGHRRQVKVRAV